MKMIRVLVHQIAAYTWGVKIGIIILIIVIVASIDYYADFKTNQQMMKASQLKIDTLKQQIKHFDSINKPLSNLSACTHQQEQQAKKYLSPLRVQIASKVQVMKLMHAAQQYHLVILELNPGDRIARDAEIFRSFKLILQGHFSHLIQFVALLINDFRGIKIESVDFRRQLAGNIKLNLMFKLYALPVPQKNKRNER